MKNPLSFFRRRSAKHYSWDLIKTTKEDEDLADFLMQNNFGPREYDYSKWKRDGKVGEHSWVRYAKWLRTVHWPDLERQGMFRYKEYIAKWPEINENANRTP